MSPVLSSKRIEDSMRCDGGRKLSSCKVIVGNISISWREGWTVIKTSIQCLYGITCLAAVVEGIVDDAVGRDAELLGDPRDPGIVPAAVAEVSPLAGGQVSFSLPRFHYFRLKTLKLKYLNLNFKIVKTIEIHSEEGPKDLI